MRRWSLASLFLLIAAVVVPRWGLAADAKLVAPGSEPDDRFGQDVCADDGVVAVGAPLDLHPDGERGGSVWVFRRTGNGWSEPERLEAAEPRDSDHFGYAVALDGDTLIASSVGRPDSTAVYAFRRAGDAWKIEQRIPGPTDGPNHFGIDVALSGDVMVVGDYLAEHGDKTSPGAAYVYRRGDAGWAKEQRLTAADPASVAQFGLYVGIDGDVIAVGAPYDDQGGKNAGAVYVFRYDPGEKAWRQEQKIVPTDATSFDWFGEPLVVSGERIVIGAHGDDDRARGAGAVYVFRRVGDRWQQEAKLTASNGAKDDELGVSVAMADGRILAGADRAGANRAGRAYLYEREGEKWVQKSEFAAPGDASGTSFGKAAAVDAETAFVGAYRASAVYAFDLPASAGDR